MKHRIYTSPFTRINEHWVKNNKVNGHPSEPYADDLVQGNSNNFHHNILDLQSNWQQIVGIDIVTETVFNYPYPQTTEKTLRPILSKRMFIIVGAPKTLNWLQSLGFKTFSPFINEDYDDIDDPTLRILALIDEIKRVGEMDIEYIKDNLSIFKHTLEHNFDLLKSLEKYEIASLKEQLKEQLNQ
jgi:hypothetical protein